MKSFPETVTAIESASSIDEVIAIVRDYLSDLDDGLAAELPWGMREKIVDNASDVALWALQFAQDKTDSGSKSPGATYGQTARILAVAAARIATLTA